MAGQWDSELGSSQLLLRFPHTLVFQRNLDLFYIQTEVLTVKGFWGGAGSKRQQHAESLVRAWPLPQFNRSTQLGGGLRSLQNATNFLAGALCTSHHQLSLFSSNDDDKETCPKRFSFLPAV